jgi:glucosylceramidase
MRLAIFIIILVCGSLGVAQSTDSHFNLVQTAEATSDRLTPQKSVPIIQEGQIDQGKYTLDIDLDQRYQKIRGFGGAFTDSTAFNFMQLPQDKQEQILESYFGSSGHGYSICRLQMGSSDFSISHYNYANETNDYELNSFSIAHDLEYIIPMIHMAQKVATKIGIELQFVATPWSPPAWMKRNNRMQNSLMPGLLQEKAIFQAWAQYFSKYLTAYKSNGINIQYVTVQNEPHVAKQFIVTYEACGFDPNHERDFLRDFLGPQLKDDHPDVGILIHDDQKDDKMTDMVNTVMTDSKAAQYVSGVAFHWYDNWGKNYDILEQVHKVYPALPLIGTEATNEKPGMEKLHVGGSLWQHGQMYAIDILRDLNHWVEGWIDWNMLLDYRGGPSSQHLGPLKDLGNCDSPIRANFTSFPYYPLDDPQGDFDLIFQPSYYHYGHFTRFLPRGSQRVSLVQSPEQEPNEKGFPTGLESTSFVAMRDTDNEQLVVIVTNFLDDASSFTINVKGIGSANVNIPAQAIQTLTLDLQ